MTVIHKYLRKYKKFPHVWCAGCSNGIILHSLTRAIDTMKLNKDDVVLVSGIGCSSRAPVYVDFTTLHTTHGRAIPFATGVKAANPKLKVIIITGDGDALAIGGNHFIHACRRNMDLTVIVFNNNIYGMTGGQRSPTTPLKAISSSTPYGSPDHPFNICELAIAAGATYVARGTSYHVKQLDNIILKGIQHKGISIIEVMSTCATLYGRMNRKGTAADMLIQQKKEAMPVEEWEMLPSVLEREQAKLNNIIIGILCNYKKPEYLAEVDGFTNKILKEMNGEKENHESEN